MQTPRVRPETWEQSVCLALKRLGGHATLLAVYHQTIKRRRDELGIQDLGKTPQATIRRTVQKSPQFVQLRRRSGIWYLKGHTQPGTPQSQSS